MTEHDDTADLLGAYALDALSPEEAQRVEELLATSPRLQAEVDDYREVAALLAYSGADAPDDIWDRIQAQLDGDAEQDALPLPFERRRPATSRPQWLAAFGGAVAAAVLVVVGFVVLDSDPEPVDDPDIDSSLELASGLAFLDEDARVTQFSVGVPSEGEVRAAVLKDGTGFIDATGLVDLPPDRTYQLWGQTPEAVISLGVLGPAPAIAAFEAGPGVTTLMLTEEVFGGVGQSDNPAIGVGELS